MQYNVQIQRNVMTVPDDVNKSILNQ